MTDRELLRRLQAAGLPQTLVSRRSVEAVHLLAHKGLIQATFADFDPGRWGFVGRQSAEVLSITEAGLQALAGVRPKRQLNPRQMEAKRHSKKAAPPPVCTLLDLQLLQRWAAVNIELPLEIGLRGAMRRLARLKAAGLVVADITADERRAVLLSVTPEGQAAVAKLPAWVPPWESPDNSGKISGGI